MHLARQQCMAKSGVIQLQADLVKHARQFPIVLPDFLQRPLRLWHQFGLDEGPEISNFGSLLHFFARSSAHIRRLVRQILLLDGAAYINNLVVSLATWNNSRYRGKSHPSSRPAPSTPFSSSRDSGRWRLRFSGSAVSCFACEAAIASRFRRLFLSA